MSDLSTTYLGIKLKNPLVVSASPLSERMDTLVRLQNAGVSAVVMHSLFEEQIMNENQFADQVVNYGADSSPEAASYFPTSGRYSVGADEYINHLVAVKRSLTIPVIASLNGTRDGDWVRYARQMEEAGADALELNLYELPVEFTVTAAEIEDHYITLTTRVCASVRIPVAVKIGPYFTALPNFIQRVVKAGARGVVLFNRFYQPDVDLDLLDIAPTLSLSDSRELRLPLRWIALLCDRVAADFALTTGIQNGQHVIKAMMVGARVGMVASELLRRGPERATEMLAEIMQWMERHEYDSIRQMQGSMAAKSVADPRALERANYMKVLSAFRSR